MSMIDKVKEKVGDWLFSVAIKKAVKRLVLFMVSYITAHNISVDISSIPAEHIEQVLTASIYIPIELLRNFLKTKYPDKFGWL